MISSFFDGLVNWAAHGLWSSASWWQVLLFTLVVTHLTICGVTIFLHRAQAHRALTLGPVPSHFFRFWLWLTTGMVTKEWVAIHRKHHAKCETEEDPHSPMTRGIKTVLLQGAELYRAEAKNRETIVKYGHNTPDDWIERNLYTRHSALGVSIMLIVDVALFGALGLSVWAVQMLWIPINAAGIINGIGHYWGYRNFEAPDTSTNVSPWGILIGGEELHNNHHTYATAAKFSVKPYEFDIGWMYICALEKLGWATVKKIPPKLALGEVKPVADSKTLEALIANRYEVMAKYAHALRETVSAELAQLKSAGAKTTAVGEMRLARRWLHRDQARIPRAVQPRLEQVMDASPKLAKLVTMREELRQLWTRTNVSAEQLVTDLQGWCRRAEASGIVALEEFSRKLRSAHLAA